MAKADIFISMSGALAVDKGFKTLDEELQKKVLRKATRAVANYTKRQMLPLVPVRTGRLKSAISVKALKRASRKKAKGKIGHSVVMEGSDNMFVGDTYYAGFLEYGTKKRRADKGKNRGAIPANTFDFMRRALDMDTASKRAMFVAIVNNWLATELPKEFAKHRAKTLHRDTQKMEMELRR